MAVVLQADALDAFAEKPDYVSCFASLGSGEGVMKRRYCEMCDEWFSPRETECPECGLALSAAVEYCVSYDREGATTPRRCRKPMTIPTKREVKI